MFKIYFLLPLLIPLALTKWDFLGGAFHRLDRWAARLGARPWRAMALVALVSICLDVGISLYGRLPVPYVNDEFAYLLIGDTFAHGRLTNPTPPFAEHFETIHEILRPTYAGKYPPGQGAALAIGELLGLPIIGVWISTAIACAAIYWMLTAWVPARWALAGGRVGAINPQVLEWSQNFWGGSVAMIGGALLAGGFRRLLDQPRTRDAIWMGLGLAILANSRPFEGCVVGILTLTALIIWQFRGGAWPVGLLLRRIYLPLLAILVIVAAQIGYYNLRVTGNMFLMPHILNAETYSIVPEFLFGKQRAEPAYRFPDIQGLYESDRDYFDSQRRSPAALAGAIASKFWTLAQGYLWSYLLVVALIALPWALKRDRRLWCALFIGIFFVCAQSTTLWVFPHYAAPAAGLLFVLVVESMRSLNAWHLGTRRPGRNIVRGLLVLFMISYFQLAAKMAARDPNAWYMQRDAILKKLRAEPFKSLVIIKYAPDHNPNREWIYNEADIPSAKVVLAQDMGDQNWELMNYFHDRTVWVVHADDADPKLEPYPGSQE